MCVSVCCLSPSFSEIQGNKRAAATERQIRWNSRHSNDDHINHNFARHFQAHFVMYTLYVYKVALAWRCLRIFHCQPNSREKRRRKPGIISTEHIKLSGKFEDLMLNYFCFRNFLNHTEPMINEWGNIARPWHFGFGCVRVNFDGNFTSKETCHKIAK